MTDVLNKKSIPIVIAINVVKLKMEISVKAVLSNIGDKTQWTLLYYWNFADKWLFQTFYFVHSRKLHPGSHNVCWCFTLMKILKCIVILGRTLLSIWAARPSHFCKRGSFFSWWLLIHKYFVVYLLRIGILIFSSAILNNTIEQRSVKCKHWSNPQSKSQF